MIQEAASGRFWSPNLRDCRKKLGLFTQHAATRLTGFRPRFETAEASLDCLRSMPLLVFILTLTSCCFFKMKSPTKQVPITKLSKKGVNVSPILGENYAKAPLGASLITIPPQNWGHIHAFFGNPPGGTLVTIQNCLHAGGKTCGPTQRSQSK